MKLVVLGAMTGTSCDALDAACVRFELDGRLTAPRFKLLWTASTAYPAALRDAVLRHQEPGTRLPIEGWLKLHRSLGDWYGTAIAGLIGSKKGPRIDLIANHGQTVAHFPPVSTLQLGEPSSIALKTGLTVASDFRWGDVCAGGQGAPLVPGFHQLVAQSLGLSRKGISIHNLGGISNLTYPFAGRDSAGPLAWDTGPANLWIDAVVRVRSGGKLQFDDLGQMGKKGRANEGAVRKLLAHPFFKLTPPKSTGRDAFSESDAVACVAGLSTDDAVATVTRATAASIVRDYHRHILGAGRRLSDIYFCGGGSRNAALLAAIEDEFNRIGHPVAIHTTAKLGLDPQSMEAIAFAFLGYRAAMGLALGGSWTGAAPGAPPAKLTPGKNWRRLLLKLSR